MRPLGSVDLGGGGETLLVANAGGASTTLVSAFGLVRGALVGLRAPDACEGEDGFCGGWLFGVGGGVQHSAGATCEPSRSGGYRLVIRRGDARHPLPEHYEDTIFDRQEIQLRRVGDSFIGVGEDVDVVSYGQWVEPWRWWMLADCPGVAGVDEDGQPLRSGYCSGSSSNPAALPSEAAAAGYLLLEASGKLHAYAVPHLGDLTSVPGLEVAGRAVAVAAAPSGHRYWIASTAGQVHAFGVGAHFGHLLGVRLHAPVVDMVAHPSGDGYWLVAADGGVFSFNVPFHGSVPGLRMCRPPATLSVAPSLTGGGYYLLMSDAGIYTFGDAYFRGADPPSVSEPVDLVVCS